MPECDQKMPLCQCIDWKTEDIVIGVNHLMNNFVFQRFELEYSTLEPEENRRLCKIGRCSVCGKRLCIGTKLPTQDTVDGLLAKIYRWMYQLWKGPNEPLSEGFHSFREMFLALFHDQDQTFVRKWLSQPENKSVSRMYRHSSREET